jgi:hypothetical protein
MMPIVYGTLKVYKPEKNMRLIIRYTNSPVDKISSYVVQEFNKLSYPKGNNVKNSIDFIEKVKEIEIEDDECMVKFDVKSMFPSIPVDVALVQVRSFLNTTDLTNDKKHILLSLLTSCMQQKTFQFRDKYYDQISGAAIGNAASPLIADFMMDYFEKKIKFKPWCPRFFVRYVDDYFAIMKKNQVLDILRHMNEQFPTIEFTMDVEENEYISYLDLMVSKNNKKLEFNIYRKETNTNLLIRNDSYHHPSHKAAAFHSMFHRLFNIPMNHENFENERKKIYKIAQQNGYSEKFVNRIYNKHQKKKEIKTSLTPLRTEISKDLKYISVPYSGKISNCLSGKLLRHGFRLAHTNKGKLSDVLHNPKDTDRNICHKSGVYLLRCNEPGCPCIYIGETKRRFIVRFEEHISDSTKAANPESAMAYHAITNNHEIAFFEALENVQDPSKLFAYESLHLYLRREEDLVNNIPEGNLPSILYKLVEEI